MARRIIFCIIAGVFLLSGFIFLRMNPEFSLKITNMLDEDVIYLKGGKVIRGWIWDEQQGVIVGEDRQKEIFVLRANQCLRIEKDELLLLWQKLI
jgi:hypothetical protein